MVAIAVILKSRISAKEYSMRKNIKLNELDANIYGRVKFDDDGALKVDWSLAGFEVSYIADRLIVNFKETENVDQPIYIKAVRDGKFEEKFAVSTGKEKLIIENSDGEAHTLRIYLLTEVTAPLCISSVTICGDNCEILPPPEKPDLRFEFIGDSLTNGYGNLGTPDVKTFYTYEEDATETCAFMTAEEFGADIRAIAMSGHGVVKNFSGNVDDLIPEFFRYATRTGREEYDFSGWIPDVVVINAGTNDCSAKVPADEFREAASLFTDEIRKAYPDAYILWMFGMTTLKYEPVIMSMVSEKSKKDGLIGYLSVEPIANHDDEKGANGHPNVKGHRRFANELIEFLKPVIKPEE